MLLRQIRLTELTPLKKRQGDGVRDLKGFRKVRGSYTKEQGQKKNRGRGGAGGSREKRGGVFAGSETVR